MKERKTPSLPITELEPKAVAQWFEKWGRPVMERNRWFIASMVLIAAVISLSLALAFLTPLKRVQPYVIKIEDTGRVLVDPVGASPYVPGEREQKYFLAQWVIHGWTMDDKLIQGYLEKAYRVTRGKASAQFQELIENSKPMERLGMEPGLTVQVKIHSINFLKKNTALIRFETVERSEAEADHPKRTRYVLTAHFALDPPETEEEILDNPLGLFITDFSLTREL